MEKSGSSVVAKQQESYLTRARRFVSLDLWHFDLRPRSITAASIRLLQLAVMIAQAFVRDQLLLRASAMTYVTTLALIPLLVVMVAMLGVVGGQQTLVDMLVGELTAVSPDARAAILERVASVNIRSLGTLGASVLFATSVLALRHLESTLNDIWGVRSSRSWMRRFADYLAVMMVAPILTATALSLATTFQSEPLIERLLEYPLFATLYSGGLAHLPLLLFMIAFAFLYWFFPNTRVRPTSALLGAAVATVLFSMARYVYVDLSLGSARSSVLFGGMVALPLVLVWIYTCWAVVLLGAEVAFAHQNLSHYRRELRGLDAKPAEKEAVGLRIAVEVGRAFMERDPPRTADDLSERLDIPVRTVHELLDCFEERSLVVVCGREDRDTGYVPARPLPDISIADVLEAMRGTRSARTIVAGDGAGLCDEESSLEEVLIQLETAQASIAEERSIADLLAGTRREA